MCYTLSMDNLRLKDNDVLVKPTIKRSAIIEMSGGKDLPYEDHGEVVLLGNGTFEFKVGDEVLFPLYAGREKIINDEVHLFMSKDSVLAVIERN